MSRNAFFSKDRKYRYWLLRRWDENKPNPKTVMFIGLNPSTANETEDDPTIRRCIGFAKSWGYGGMVMTNLYAYVSTNPEDLFISGENIKMNNKYLLDFCEAGCDIVFAWGSFTKHKARMDEVIAMFPDAYCIDISKNGYPKHPLYLKGDLKLKRFRENNDNHKNFDYE
jgi:hypothetical protein